MYHIMSGMLNVANYRLHWQPQPPPQPQLQRHGSCLDEDDLRPPDEDDFRPLDDVDFRSAAVEVLDLVGADDLDDRRPVVDDLFGETKSSKQSSKLSQLS